MKNQSASVICIGNGWFPTSAGGLERYVYELVHSLAATSHAVELCGIGLPATDAGEPMRLTNLAQPEAPLWQRLWEARRNFAARSAAPVDAVNLHFALYSLPLLNALPKGAPVTFHFHGPWALESLEENPNRAAIAIKKWIENRVYRRCDRFIVLSKAFGEILHREYDVPWSKIHVIPGGVDTQRFQPNLERHEARLKLDWPQDKFIVFTPRRLVQRMGLDKLLQALAQLRSQHPHIWLAIAGKGPAREALEAQAQQLGLADEVRFLGFVPDDDLPVAFQAADLTVMPSQSLEGFGLVLLESLASGTPALCTPVGGMPEVLSGFSPQLITTSADADAIAQKLAAVVSGEIELPSRSACRTYAADNFSWELIAQKVSAVLLSPV